MSTLYRDFVKETAVKASGDDRLRRVLSKLPPVKWPKPAVLPLFHRTTDDAEFDDNRGRFRDLLMEAQDGRCARCSERMGRSGMSLDHVQPLAHGGRNWLGNLLLMHKVCNQKKADSLPSKGLLARLTQINHWIFIREGEQAFISEPVKVRRR